MDLEKMEQAIAQFVAGIGERFPGDDLEATPGRVARAWAEDLLSGYAADADGEMSWSPADGATGPVVLRDVSFTSVCVHHLLPFYGRAHVAYLPQRRLAGLSKIGRVVETYSRRLQIQERLTKQILETLERTLEPRGLLVVLEAEHTCMTLRGVRREGSRFLTLAAAGRYDTDAGERREMLAMLTGR